MINRMEKIYSPQDSRVALKVYQGHFAAPHSHVTHYFDLTTLRTRVSEAQAAAKLLAEGFGKDQVVDTIVCLDGMEVVGAFLAEQLLAAGVSSMNAHETIYVTAPEKGFQDRFTFGENLIPLIHRKNVLVLAGGCEYRDDRAGLPGCCPLLWGNSGRHLLGVQRAAESGGAGCPYNIYRQPGPGLPHGFRKRVCSLCGREKSGCAGERGRLLLPREVGDTEQLPATGKG